MSVLQVCSKYFPFTGGVEEHVRNLSERLIKNFEVNVATTDPYGGLKENEIINLVPITRFSSFAPRESFYFSPYLRSYLRKNSKNFDIVHVHNYHDMCSLYAAMAKSDNKLVFTPHYHGAGRDFFNSLLHVPYKLLGKKIFDKAERIICVSKFERSLIAKNFSIDPHKFAIIPNGINSKEFIHLTKCKKDYQNILFVGRLEPYKGPDNIIKALPKLDENVFLEIVGTGSSKNYLLRLSKKLGVESRVKFFENLTRTELLTRYAEADLFILLSKFEAYGITVAEALASRVPCILARTSALTEWVDNKNVFGIDYPVNIDKLAILINHVIGKKIDDLEIMDWDLISERITKLYANL